MNSNILEQILAMSKFVFHIIIIQCVFAGLLVANNAVSQNSSIEDIYVSIALQNNTIKEAFQDLENQTDFNFSYNQGVIDLNTRVSTVANNTSLGNVLRIIAQKARLNFKRIDDNIYVSRRKVLQASVTEKFTMPVLDKIVTGKVTSSEDDSELPGVNVLIKGSTRGTVTDINGNYSLEVPEGSTLVFTYVGYITAEVEVGDRSVINFNMKPDLTLLEEIVVVGYGTVKKRDLTGAIVSLDQEDMTIGAASNSVSSMIQGRAAGVEVSSNDGLPGQDLNIVIRGATSISNSNEPLYVVDGFPISAGVSIAPEDIESIDILKDAASAAIYGSRGSAGVVIITTKKGKEGKPVISLDGYAGIQSLSNKVDRLPWDDHARVMNEQYAQGPNDGNPWYDAADLALPNNTDWLDAVTRDAKIQSYTLRASGGDSNSRFSLSGSYFNQEGIFLKSAFERFSFRLNADRKFGAKTTVGMNAYTSRINGDGTDRRPGSRSLSPLYATLRAVPGRADYNDDGTLANTVLSRDTRPWLNPIGLFTERENDYLEWRTYANIFIEHKILNNLTARLNAGYDHTSGNRSRFQPAAFSSLGSDMALGTIDEEKSSTYLIEGTLNYQFNFLPNDHQLSVLVGASTQYDDFFTFGIVGSGFPSEKTLYYNLGSAENQTVTSYREDQRIISYFGRANYTFKG